MGETPKNVAERTCGLRPGPCTLRYEFASERRRASPTSRLPRQVISIEGRSAATARREEARDLETGRVCYLAIRLFKAGLRASQRSCQETSVTHSDLLVVDDDDSTRIGLTELLANAGFTVDVARDGAEAWTRWPGTYSASS